MRHCVSRFVAARPVEAVLAAQKRGIRRGRDADRVRRYAGNRDRILARDHRQVPRLRAWRTAPGLFRAARSERCAIKAAKTSPKSSKIGSTTTNASGDFPLAASACDVASLSGMARRKTRGRLRSLSARMARMSLASGLSCSARFAAHDVDLVAVGAEYAQPGVDDQYAVDVGSLRGASQQFADRDHVGRRKRLHDVGALRDAFEARREACEQRLDASFGKPRFALEPLAELFLREPAELLRLALEPDVEPDDGQAERCRERDRRRRDDGDDQPAAEGREAEQDLGPWNLTRRWALRPCW